MRVPLRRAPDERGAMALFVALVTLVLLGFTAFAADFGIAYAEREALATGADSAALAIANDIHREVLADPRPCEELEGDPDLVAAADDTADAMVSRNSPFGRTIPPEQVTATLDCVGTDDNVLQISVSADHSVDTILGGMYGVSEIEVDREAGANLGVANEVTGLRPIGICRAQALEIIAHARDDLAAGLPYRTEKIVLDKVWTGANKCSDGSGSGNWGWFEFPGQGNGANSLGDMIASGYTGTITLTGGTYAVGGKPGNNGNSSHVENAMRSIMGDVVTLPVYDEVSGNGNNVTYTVSGFLTVEMCGYDGHDITGGCFDESLGLGGNQLQVRFVEYSPAGTIDDWCGLDDPCAYNSYITGLTR